MQQRPLLPLVVAALAFCAAVVAEEPEQAPPPQTADPRAPDGDERGAVEDPCAGERDPECRARDDDAPADEDARSEADPPEAEPPAPLPPETPPEGRAPDDEPDAAPAPLEPAPAEAGAATASGVEPRLDPRVDQRDDELVPVRAEPPVVERSGLGFGGVPALNYDSDTGFGFGVIGTLYWYEPGVKPYRYALTLQLFMTSKLVQAHELRFDAVELFDLPLRVQLRGGYFSSVTQNFCGFGNAVTCDPRVAAREADARSLVGEERERFVRRYYQHRVVRPFGQATALWRLVDAPAKIMLTGGWRGHYYISGDPWADDDGDGAPDLAFTPYRGSLYAKHFPGGENGLASVGTVGLMFDARDQEAAPTSGYWVEGSLRASSFLLGSAWDYVGANLTARLYVPLYRADLDVVLAQRLVLDATVGDLPVEEMARVGGSWDYTAFGGNPMGRGVRAQRYLGRLKALHQTELRADVFEHELFEQRFRWTAAAFLDAGWVGHDWLDLGPDPLRVSFGGGGGLRVRWNRDFVIRADVATSPDEGYAPGIYLDIGNTF